MYDYFNGVLAEKSPHFVIVDIQGIGYKIWVPMSAYSTLPAVGEKVMLHTSWVVREMSQTLYGFLEKQGRDLFELLLTLSGIGPKTALGLVGHFTMEELEDCVRHEDYSSLAKAPGIGKKTAERLIVDLKGKLKVKTSGLRAQRSSSRIQDALSALLNLGYSQAHAESAVQKAMEELSEDSDLSLLITAALKYRKN